MTMKYRLRLLCAGLLFLQHAIRRRAGNRTNPLAERQTGDHSFVAGRGARYEVTYQGKPVVLESALGINGNGDWSRGMRIAGVTRSSRDTLWTPVYGGAQRNPGPLQPKRYPLRAR